MKIHNKNSFPGCFLAYTFNKLNSALVDVNNSKLQCAILGSIYTNSTTDVEKEIALSDAKAVIICVWNGYGVYQNPCIFPISAFNVNSILTVEYDGIKAQFTRSATNKVKIKTSAFYALLYAVE